MSWSDLCSNEGIDKRLGKAISKMKLSEPLPVQTKVIPLALSGKDVLVRAPTGSGKTLAYCVPLLNKLLSQSTLSELSGLVLVPTKDLCKQVFTVLNQLINYCFQEVRIDFYEGGTGPYRNKNKPLPHLLVTTPGGLLELFTSRGYSQPLANVSFIAIDEADLMLSYGYEKDMRDIVARVLPSQYQAVLVSATLSEDVETLRGLMLHKPELVELEAATPAPSSLKQFYLTCTEDDKHLIIYGLLKLKVVEGKVVVFTSSLDRAYKLKLILERFGIPAAALNGELPSECRAEVISAFNQEVVNLLIVTDEGWEEGEDKSDKKSFGAHRGIDFQGVKCVINLDMPVTATSYLHRVGRAARANNEGCSLTLVTENDDKLLAKIMKKVGSETLKALELDLHDLEGLRYRVDDVSKGVSRKAIAAARQRELVKEVLHSKKVRETLNDNAEDVKALRRAMRTLGEANKVKAHLRELPSYLIPKQLLDTPLVDGAEELNPVARAARKLMAQMDGGASVNEGKTSTNKRMINEDALDGFESKRFKLGSTLRSKLLAKGENKAQTLEQLPPISGRKLWKIKHKKALKKPRVEAGLHMRSKQAQRVKKIAKRFH